MKGIQTVSIAKRRVRFDFSLERNISIVTGDSATGKTTLIDMIETYLDQGASSGITMQSSKECAVLRGKQWKRQLSYCNDCIVFIDEGNSFVSTKEFAEEIKQTDNYYVIVTRENLYQLPYSVDAIYEIKQSGRYGKFKTVYNHFQRVYGDLQTHEGAFINVDEIITEDSNSGFTFFEAVAREKELICISSNGKSNLINTLKQCTGKALVIADGAAIGSEINK